MNVREEMTEVIAARLAAQSGIGDQANAVGPYYRALAEEIVNDIAHFFHAARKAETPKGENDDA